jgi:hypothetical protein
LKYVQPPWDSRLMFPLCDSRTSWLLAAIERLPSVGCATIMPSREPEVSPLCQNSTLGVWNSDVSVVTTSFPPLRCSEFASVPIIPESALINKLLLNQVTVLDGLIRTSPELDSSCSCPAVAVKRNDASDCAAITPWREPER